MRAHLLKSPTTRSQTRLLNATTAGATRLRVQLVSGDDRATAEATCFRRLIVLAPPPALLARVTAAKRILPNTTSKIGLRFTEHVFLLEAYMNTAEVFGYGLTEAANRFGVLLHTVVVLLNHSHTVATGMVGDLSYYRPVSRLALRGLSAIAKA
jgi:hypothetical protein